MKKSLIIALLGLTACASIVEGHSQQIMVNTNPPEAKCQLLRKDMPIGAIESTPGSVYIEKTKDDILIKCHKKGYQDALYYNHSGSSGATFGNIILGGGIGWAVDSASGADNKYESPVNITLSRK